MKRIAEKVVLVAHICITFVFALLTVLYVTNAIPQEPIADNSIVLILLLVLAVLFVALSAYLIYVNFSEKVNVKRILLYYDSESATSAKASVVDNIVYGCAKKVKEIKVQKVKIRLDEKQGLIATIYVKAPASNMTDSIARLRALLVDNFKTTLGLTFNAINFEISQLTKKFVPDVKAVENKKKKVVTDCEVVTPNADDTEPPKTTARNDAPIPVEYEDVSDEN